jgi:folate-binding protein YgfZ
MTHTDEYAAACSGAVLFDLSDRSKIELVGPEARLFLHNLCTNDVKNLAAGAGCEAFLCTAKARVVAYALVGCFRVADQDVLWLDFAPGFAAKVLQHLDHHLISERVELADRTAELGLLRLAGPRAKVILEQHFGRAMPEVPDLHHVALGKPEDPDGIVYVRRQPAVSVSAYDLICRRASVAPLIKALTDRGAVTATNQTHEVLRVEAGTPEYSIDIDENRLVMEMGRTRQAISYTKGCFLGQEPIVMARDRGHVNRTLLGITVIPSPEATQEPRGSLHPIPRGARLFQGNEEVGHVTSSVFSPRLGQVIGLAYLKRGSQTPGTVLTIEPDTDGRHAAVASLPFVPA